MTETQKSEFVPALADDLDATPLAVVLIGPDEIRRADVARALKAVNAQILREWPKYPQIDHLQQVLDQDSDIIIVDLDGSQEYALEVVESFCAASQATVMVYSRSSDSELMIRCMRAGAREYLALPLKQVDLEEAMVRASARRAAKVTKRTDGSLNVFWGAKGGSGLTTLATGFALSSAADLKSNTLLIDLDLPLGDAALQLGLTPSYSTVDALTNHSRLDGNFLSKLLVKHSSGLSVLAAPGKVTPSTYTVEAVNKLLQVARSNFSTVVVDTGSHMVLAGTSMFEKDSSIYLVAQVGITELRNSNRLVLELFHAHQSRLQIILNRFTTSMLAMDEQHITKTLTMPAQWHVPNETGGAKKMQETGTPLALQNGAVARLLKQMTRSAAGMPPEQEKKKRLMGLF